MVVTKLKDVFMKASALKKFRYENVLFSINKVRSVYWISGENSLELIELSIINKVSLV
jgi:hypothetical protein